MNNIYLYGAADATKPDFEKAKLGLQKKNIQFAELFYTDLSQIIEVLTPVRSWFPGISIAGFPFLVWDEPSGRKIAMGADIVKLKATEPTVEVTPIPKD